jgi:predicted DNA-binding antitoxin AbrB/MazE fold protein
MSKIIELKYKNGVLIPLRKVPLREGEIVYVEIIKPKVVTKKFQGKLRELREKAKRVENARRILEEVRDDSHRYIPFC